MARTAHGTLAANVVTSVTVDSGWGRIVVINRQQSGVIWVRLDGIDPVPEGPDTFAVFGAREFTHRPNTQRSTFEVLMFSDNIREYSVEAF